MLWPSMVSIVNGINHILESGKDSITTESFLEDIDHRVELERNYIEALQTKKGTPLRIATFSCSGTLMKILQPFSASCEILYSQSTPGDEGKLMAKDLHTRWVPGVEIQELLTQNGVVDILLVRSDCIMPTQTIHKVGTRKLCEIARAHGFGMTYFHSFLR